MEKKVTPTLSHDVQKSLDEITTTSQKIRYLTREGFSRGDVARVLNIRYQHVRNVLITPVKKVS